MSCGRRNPLRVRRPCSSCWNASLVLTPSRSARDPGQVTSELLRSWVQKMLLAGIRRPPARHNGTVRHPGQRANQHQHPTVGWPPCWCPVLSDCLSSQTNAGTDPRRHDAADSPVCRADRCTGLPRATTQQVSDRVQVDLTPGGSRRSSSPLMTSSIRADSPACRGEHWFVGAGSQDQTDSDKIRLSSQGGLSERVTRGLRRSRGSQRSRGCNGRS
jgi:hypothetical protein